MKDTVYILYWIYSLLYSTLNYSKLLNWLIVHQYVISTHLSTFKPEKQDFAKHAQPQPKKLRAYKMKKVYCPNVPYTLPLMYSCIKLHRPIPNLHMLYVLLAVRWSAHVLALTKSWRIHQRPIIPVETVFVGKIDTMILFCLLHDSHKR